MLRATGYARMVTTFNGWVRVLGYGSGVRGRKVNLNSRDCALVSDLVRAESYS